MTSPASFVRRLWHALRRRSLDRQMDEEFEFHIDMETEELIRQGVPPREARRRALVAFGGVERHREQMREGRTAPLLDRAADDVRAALRSVRRAPGFAILSALTIALGVGATASVFSAINALLLRPLELPEPTRLVGVMEHRRGAMSQGAEGVRLPFPRYEAYREATGDVFHHLAAFRYDPMALRIDEETRSRAGARVSANYFATLGLAPALGRFFDRDDVRYAVISHRLWTGSFGSDPETLGRAIEVDGRTYTVVGVAPSGFTGTTVVESLDIWLPFRAAASARDETAFAAGWVGILGRLRPGVTLAHAGFRVDQASRSIPPDESQTTVQGASLEPISGLAGPNRDVIGGFLALLLGLAILVLFIAAGNVAGMLLARASRRRREIAVRLALGAQRRRLVRHLLSETLVVCLAGCVVGVGLAYLGSAWIERLPGSLDLDMPLDLSPDLRVAAFAFVVTVATGLAFGLWPALQASKVSLLPALKVGGGGSERAAKSRGLFVGSQVTLSVLLLILAGLFARSLQRGLRVDLGYRTDGIAVAQLALSAHGYDEAAGRLFHQQLRERLAAMPGVEAVGLSSNVLGDGGRFRSDVRTPDPVDAGPTRINASFLTVDPSFASTVGLVLLEGRGITDADAEGAPPVVVVTRSLAERLWPGASPIGRRLHTEGTDREVVGVVEDGRFITAGVEPRPSLFQPFAQRYADRMALHLRAPGREADVLRALEEQVRVLDPRIPVESPTTLSQVLTYSLFPHRFGATLVGVFGMVGLALAAIGLYGVTSFRVAGRTHELGIRRALGATNQDVLRQVISDAARLALIGATVGIAIGAVCAFVARSYLIGLHPLDPPIFVGVPLLLFVVAVIAAAVPARRAARVHPTEALRTE